MKKFLSLLLTTTSSVLLLSGCVSVNYGVGSVEGATPPQVVSDPENPTLRKWNDPGLFGPVPRDKAALGAATCATLNANGLTFKAAGYHRDARDFNGNKFPDGGFYCVQE
jgi:hypothetical protein